ncbi:MAG: PCRF domain-containing protein, partial [Leptospiraceae bacterium]|nr:PCRF domain-containing protein [Leptospiraceae bacterium]
MASWRILSEIMAVYKNKAELLKAARSLAAELDQRWRSRNVEGELAELGDLTVDMEAADFWDDQNLAREKSQRKSSLERKLEPWTRLRSEVQDFPDLMELSLEEFDDEKSALDSLEQDLQVMQDKFEALLMADALSGRDDACDAIITISSGAGGTESQDWADMLLRMYKRWFEKRGFRAEQLD